MSKLQLDDTSLSPIAMQPPDNASNSSNTNQNSNDNNRSNNNNNSSQKQSLPKTVTLLPAISITIGTIIGTGIFMSPKTIIENVGSIGWSIVIWICCGLYALSGGLSYLELGLMIKKSGGEYAYLTYTFGNSVGYVLIFINLFIKGPAGAGIVALTFADYITSSYQKYDLDGNPDTIHEANHISKVLFALSLIWGAAIVNMYSTRAGLKLQTVFFYLKLTLCGIIIFSGLIGLIKKKGDDIHLSLSREIMWRNSTVNPSSLALAFYGGLWPYEGWNSLNYMTEEVVTPERTMSLSIIISVVSVTLLYVLINLSYFVFLTVEQVKRATAVAVTFGEAAFNNHTLLQVFIPVFVFLSAAGTFNGTLLCSSRLLMVAGRDGTLPSWFSLASKTQNTPVISIFCNSLLTSLYILPSSANFDSLVSLFGFTNLVFYGTTYLAVAWLRKLEPIRSRPFKVWLIVPILMAVVSYSMVLIPLFHSPKFEYFYVLGFFILAIICYYLLFYRGIPSITVMNSRFENFLVKKFNLVQVASEYNENVVGSATVQSTYTRFDDD